MQGIRKEEFASGLHSLGGCIQREPARHAGSTASKEEHQAYGEKNQCVTAARSGTWQWDRAGGKVNRGAAEEGPNYVHVGTVHKAYRALDNHSCRFFA